MSGKPGRRRRELEGAAAFLSAGLVAFLVSGCADPDRRYPIAADRGFEPVELVVENTGEEVLRCTFVLAHFITKDLGEIAPGTAVSVSLERRAADGVLAAGRHKGEPMLVENLLCGASSDWQGTAADLPLLQLRRDERTHYHLRCRAGGRIDCEIR